MTKMSDAGVEPNDICLNSMIDVYAKSGDIGKAEEWFAKLVASGAKLAANNFNTVINACAKGGDVKRAEAWLADMQAKGFAANVRSYTSVIDACAKVGDTQRALSVFQAMKSQ